MGTSSRAPAAGQLSDGCHRENRVAADLYDVVDVDIDKNSDETQQVSGRKINNEVKIWIFELEEKFENVFQYLSGGL